MGYHRRPCTPAVALGEGVQDRDVLGGIRCHATRRARQFKQARDDPQLPYHPHEYAVAERLGKKQVKTVVRLPVFGGLCFQRSEPENVATQRVDRFRFDAADRELYGLAFEQFANLERLEELDRKSVV